MKRIVRIGFLAALGLTGLFLAAGAAWFLSLPRPTAAAAVPVVPPEEVRSLLTALKPPKRPRPAVAIIGINDATETTDYLMPFGILSRADVADVVALSTSPGPMTLYPALKVQPQATIAEFDAAHPQGADYVIVPAMSRDDDPAALRWIRDQAARGATIIGVCAGAKVVAAAGLLDGRQATTHWYYLDELEEEHPTIRYVPDRRLVMDDGVATTPGISASMPTSLTLIEAIAGREKAAAVARELGLEEWTPGHASEAFKFTRPFALTAIVNGMRFWSRERFALELRPGADEATLALVADAWSRTYRSGAFTFAPSGQPVATRGGLLILPDHPPAASVEMQELPDFSGKTPMAALNETLRAIDARYGSATADFVAMQLEYPRPVPAP